MMSFTSRTAVCACLLLAFSSLLLAHADHGEEHTCTAGRMFVSDANAAKIYVYDLDSTVPTLVQTFDSAAVGMTMYHTGTLADRVVGIFGGNATTNFLGTVQVFRSGITTDNHGDHSDIVKGAPGKYSFEFSGYKPAHFTASAGYLTMFYDGVWVADQATPVQPSSAQFIPESLFTEDALTVASAGRVTEIVLPGGAHHGVAYALDSTAFLVSQANPARKAFTTAAPSGPNGFSVYSAAGVVTSDLNNALDESKNCSLAHGAAHIDNTYMFGCSSVGVLKVSIDATTKAVSSSKLAYPVAGFRSSTLYAQKQNGLFVGNLNDAAGALVPSYALSFPATTTAAALTTSQTIQTASTTARFCAFAVDQGTPEEAGVSLVATLNPNGQLYVSKVGADGVPVADSTKTVAVSGAAITCANWALVAGYRTMYVLSKSDNVLLTVNLEALMEGEDGVVTRLTLPFTPASATISLPYGFDCGAAGAHEHDGGDADKNAAASVNGGLALVTMLLLAAWHAARSL